MGAFQGRDDAFQAAALVERGERFVVGHRGVFDAADVMQPGVFRADAGVVEAGGNRMRIDDLAIVVLLIAVPSIITVPLAWLR